MRHIDRRHASGLGALARRHERGLTMVELLVGLAIIMLAALIGFPALQKTIARSNLEGSAQQIMALMRTGRLEAIKRAAPAVMTMDATTGHVTIFIDIHNAAGLVSPDLIYNPKAGEPEKNTDHIVAEMNLPPQVMMGGPPAYPDPVFGFTDPGGLGKRAVFNSDGGVADIGAFHIRDGRENYLEIRVEPQATGRIQLLKWHTTDNEWFTRDMRNGKVLWEWY